MTLDKIATHPLQTDAWRSFRKAWGNEILETKYGIITLHKVPLLNKKIGMFIRGPKPEKAMLADLKRIARQNNLIFIKLEPNVATSTSLKKLLIMQGAVAGKTLFTPTSYWINLAKSEDELLKSFKPKTRYNIRYAEKAGVRVKEDNSDRAFDAYIKLMRETVKRQKFYAHSETYHRLMWKFLKKANIANLLTATYKNKIIAAWVVFRWRDFLYYPYGASTHTKKNVQASSAMMWGAIKFGKEHKLRTFDLWGREPDKGFAKFKEGFNPQVVEFIGTWDLIIDKNLYKIYRVLEKIRWVILRTKSHFTTPKF